MGFHSYHIYFNVQANSTSLEDWISLLTLCLAPLLVHIIVGVPQPVYLHDRAPRWHDRIVHYNPTSIIWRYFVIADRRLRSRNWTASDMAASNALFWTADGWDGSEAMMVQSRAHCAEQPRHTTAQFFSVSTGKTVIITAQGIQAIALIINGITRFSRFFIKISMPNIFFPFTILGLVRLCAAMWLTEDYTYLSSYSATTTLSESSTALLASTTMLSPLSSPRPSYAAHSRPSVYSLPAFDFEKPSLTSHPSDTITNSNTSLSHAPTSPRGLASRTVSLLFLACLWLLPLLTMLPFRWGIYFTGTLFSMGIFYFIFLSITVFSFALTIFTKRSTNTTHPYTAYAWYKVYTILLFVLMLVLVVISGLEVRRTPCGKYTSYPSVINVPHAFDFDDQLCGVVRIGQGSLTGVVGLALDQQGILVRGFDGWCVGDWGNSSGTL